MRRLPFSFVVLTLINFIVPNVYINGVWGAEVEVPLPQAPCDSKVSPCGFLQKIQTDSEKLSDVPTLVKDVNDAKVVVPPLVIQGRNHPFHLLFNRNLREVKNPSGVSSNLDLSRNVFGDFFSLLGLGGSPEGNTTAASPGNSPASSVIPEVPPVASPPKLEVVPPSKLEQPPPPPASAEESKPEEPAKKVKREENAAVISSVEGNATSVPIPAPPPLPPAHGILELFIFTIIPSNSSNLNVTETADAKPLVTE